MNAEEVFALAVVVGAVGIFAAILLACRQPKERDWHKRNLDPLVKGMPSFEVYARKEKHSRAIEAANRR